MKVEISDWGAVFWTTLVAMGGWAALVAALSHWLGELWAKRILQNEGAKLSQHLAALSHELTLQKSSYEKHLNLLLDYYTTFYRHYRLCQRAAHADAIRSPDGETALTKDAFLEQLETFVSEWSAQEGKIRLILPSSILALHSEAMDAFNGFKRVMGKVKHDNATKKAKAEAFAKVESVKQRLESGLRQFLRTEHLLKVERK